MQFLEWGLPDDTMTDVRIVHDAVGAYADWRIVNGILPYGDRKERYLIGEMLPNYPVPALNLDIVPVIFDMDVIALDIVNRCDDGPWPVVASFERE